MQIKTILILFLVLLLANTIIASEYNQRHKTPAIELLGDNAIETSNNYSQEEAALSILGNNAEKINYNNINNNKYNTKILTLIGITILIIITGFLYYKKRNN